MPDAPGEHSHFAIGKADVYVCNAHDGSIVSLERQGAAIFTSKAPDDGVPEAVLPQTDSLFVETSTPYPGQGTHLWKANLDGTFPKSLEWGARGPVDLLAADDRTLYFVLFPAPPDPDQGLALQPYTLDSIAKDGSSDGQPTREVVIDDNTRDNYSGCQTDHQLDALVVDDQGIYVVETCAGNESRLLKFAKDGSGGLTANRRLLGEWKGDITGIVVDSDSVYVSLYVRGYNDRRQSPPPGSDTQLLRVDKQRGGSSSSSLGKPLGKIADDGKGNLVYLDNDGLSVSRVAKSGHGKSLIGTLPSLTYAKDWTPVADIGVSQNAVYLLAQDDKLKVLKLPQQ
jgi:hypothetical protein